LVPLGIFVSLTNLAKYDTLAAMKLIEANTPELAKRFLELPLMIYREDPEWIRPLDKDIEQVFDPKLNKTFRHGEMNYNPPYYQKLFEAYGFQTYYEQHCFSLNPNDKLDPKFKEAHDRLIADGNYHTEHIRKNNLWMKLTGSCHKFYGIVFGVIPEFQGKGVDGLMIWAGAEKIISLKKYEFMELQWIGDFNPKMISITRSLGAHKCRTLITYRKLFDSNKVYKRHPILT